MPAFLLGKFREQAFITHSENKGRGTGDITEHRTSGFVVGAGNETREEMFHD
jgi:hypothetical protein